MIKKIILLFFVTPIYLESNEQLTNADSIKYDKLCLKYVSIALEEATECVNGLEIVSGLGLFSYIFYGGVSYLATSEATAFLFLPTDEKKSPDISAAQARSLLSAGFIGMALYTISKAIYKMFFRNLRLTPLEPKTAEIKEYNAILASLKDLQKRAGNLYPQVRAGMFKDSNYPFAIRWDLPEMSQAEKNAYVFYEKKHKSEYEKIIIDLEALKKKLIEKIYPLY
jgi:hypothetical protein